MNISDFFEKQSPEKISHSEKNRIFSSFVKKRLNKNNTRWKLVSKRSALYASVSFLGALLFFVSPSIQEEQLIPNTVQVFAQTIGTITKSEGEYVISNNGRKIKTESIQANDIIELEQSAKLTILINDSFQTEIVGPATFEIVPIQENNLALYKLKFNNGGDFITIDTTKEDSSSEISVETSQGLTIKNQRNANTQEKKKEKIAFTVIGSSKSKDTTIVNKSNTPIQASTSADIGEESSPIIVQAEHIVKVKKNITNEENLEIIESKTFDTEIEEKILASIVPQEKEETKIYENIDKTQEEIDIKATTLHEEKTKTITQNLYKSFITRDIENIVSYHLAGDEAAYEISRDNLRDRINRIGGVFEEFSEKQGNSISRLISSIEEIEKLMSINNIKNRKSLHNLATTKRRLELLRIYEVGGQKDIYQKNKKSWSLEEIKSILKITKINRKYKIY